jgi:hypothetical protein
LKITIIKAINAAFTRMRERWRFRYWKKQADYLNEVSGKKIRVIKIAGTYRLYCRDDIVRLRKANVFKKNLDNVKLNKITVYIANKRVGITNN